MFHNIRAMNFSALLCVGFFCQFLSGWCEPPTPSVIQIAHIAIHRVPSVMFWLASWILIVGCHQRSQAWLNTLSSQEMQVVKTPNMNEKSFTLQKRLFQNC